MNIDTLDRAAALTRVENGSVNELLRNVLQIRVRSHICRVITAQF
jgi:hypothetical protein